MEQAHKQEIQLQTRSVSNMPLGMQEPELKAIEQMISDRRTFINTRNRHNYKLRSANGTNLQLKSTSQLKPKGRKRQSITVDDIQSYVSNQVKPKRAKRTNDELLVEVASETN